MASVCFKKKGSIKNIIFLTLEDFGSQATGVQKKRDAIMTPLFVYKVLSFYACGICPPPNENGGICGSLP
jgi:hypothetical protein